jgi:hypothetical protein
MPKLSQIYQALHPEEMQRLRGLGKAATELKSAGAPHTFGPHQTQVERAVQRRAVAAGGRDVARIALRPETPALGTRSQSDGPAGWSHAERRHCQGCQDRSEGRGKVAEGRDSARHVGCARVVERHRAGCEGESRIRKMPGLAEHSFCLMPNPSAHGAVFQYVRENAVSATCACSLPTDTRTSNVAAAPTSLWEGLHTPILDANCPSIVEEAPQRSRKPRCDDVGLCLCSPAGCRLFMVRNCFLNTRRASFRLTSPGRALLKTRRAVAMLIGHRTLNESPSGIASRAETGCDDGQEYVKWVHVGWHQWSPYHSGYRMLTLDDTQRYIRAGPQVQLKASSGTGISFVAPFANMANGVGDS